MSTLTQQKIDDAISDMESIEKFVNDLAASSPFTTRLGRQSKNIDALSAEVLAMTADLIAPGTRQAFESSTTMGAPAAGGIRFNNATIASATAIAISNKSVDTGNPDDSDFKALWGASSSTVRGLLIFKKIGAPEQQAIFKITAGVADNTTWLQVTLTWVTGTPTFTAADHLSILFVPTGDKGEQSGYMVPPQGRLTLTTATAVPTIDVAGATTVYYTPAGGQFVPLWDGVAQYVMTDIGGQLSQTTTDTTKSPNATGNNANYDMFVWNDAGTFRCTRGPNWSSDTVRGAGALTTELEFISGFFVNKYTIVNGPLARKGTYVGTVRTNGTATVDLTFGSLASGGGAAVLGVWNAYNQVPVSAVVRDSTTNWLYQSATIRNANNSATNRVSFVAGLAVCPITASYSCGVNYTSGASSVGKIGFALDAVSYDFADYHVSISQAIATTLKASGAFKPQLGFHYLQACENTNATNNNQFSTAIAIQSLIYNSFF